MFLIASRDMSSISIVTQGIPVVVTGIQVKFIPVCLTFDAGAGEEKKSKPSDNNQNQAKDKQKAGKNGPNNNNNSDIKPVKSKADAVDTAPVRPSKQQQQQQQQPQKEKQKQATAGVVPAAEDFPSLGMISFLLDTVAELQTKSVQLPPYACRPPKLWVTNRFGRVALSNFEGL